MFDWAFTELVFVCCWIVFPGFLHSSMEPKWWAKALEAERYGELGHGPGFYDSGRQCLHHSLWSPQAEPQRLSKNTHIQVFFLFLLITYILYVHPLSLLPSFHPNRSFLSCLTVQFAPIDIHVVSMFLVLFSPDLHNPLPDLQTHWPLQTLREISTGKQLKNKIQPLFFYQKIIALQKTANKREPAVVTKRSGSYTTQHLFPVDKQESGDNSSKAHVTSQCLSPLLPESDLKHWADTNAQPHWHTHTWWLLSRLQFLIALMTFKEDVMVPS